MDDVNDKVNAELELIPRGGLSQNMFRGLYQMIRANALGANAEARLSARQAVDRATAMIRADDPSFAPVFDPSLVADMS